MSKVTPSVRRRVSVVAGTAGLAAVGAAVSAGQAAADSGLPLNTNAVPALASLVTQYGEVAGVPIGGLPIVDKVPAVLGQPDRGRGPAQEAALAQDLTQNLTQDLPSVQTDGPDQMYGSGPMARSRLAGRESNRVTRATRATHTQHTAAVRPAPAAAPAPRAAQMPQSPYYYPGDNYYSADPYSDGYGTDAPSQADGPNQAPNSAPGQNSPGNVAKSLPLLSTLNRLPLVGGLTRLGTNS